MSVLTKEEILKNRPAITAEVSCPTMGGIIRLRAMSASTKDLFEQRFANLTGTDVGVTENIRACFLVHSIVDDNNELVFTMDDLEALGNQDAKDIDELFKKASEMSGLNDDDEKELKKK